MLLVEYATGNLESKGRVGPRLAEPHYYWPGHEHVTKRQRRLTRAHWKGETE